MYSAFKEHAGQKVRVILDVFVDEKYGMPLVTPISDGRIYSYELPEELVQFGATIQPLTP